MAGTCAACMTPITRGDEFRIIRTEVFHAACVGRAADSLMTRARRKIVKLTYDHDTERAEAARLRIYAQDLETSVRQLEDRNTELERKLATERGRVTTERSRADHAENAVHASIRLRSGEMAEKREIETALEGARRQVANLQAQLMASAKDALPIPVTTDTRDDAEIRFSLLELTDPEAP